MTYTPGGAGLPDLPLNTEVESGRQIYGENTFLKAIEFVGSLTPSVAKNIAHGITGIDRLVEVYGTCVTSTAGALVPMTFGSPFSAFAIQIQADATNVIVTPGASWTGVNILTNPRIIIEYTKT